MANVSTYVVFRYDDLGADGPGEREHNSDRRAIWEAEQAVDRLFENAGLPYVVGVIPQANPAFLMRSAARQGFPFSADPEKVTFVKRSMAAGRMQVAMHGFTHTNYRPPKARSSEFSRPFAEQYRDLVAGRKILAETLGGGPISAFIPPFNGWNKHTAAALVKSGFKILSADRYRPGDATTPLINIPFTAQLWELEELLAQDRLPAGSLVVVLYHPPQIARLSRHEHRYYGVERMEALLAKLAAKPEVKVVSLDGLLETCTGLTSARYIAAARLQRLRSLWSRVLPARYLPGAAKEYLYLPKEESALACRPWIALTVLATIGVFAGSFVFFDFVSNLLPKSLALLLAGGSLLGTLGGVWLLVDVFRRGFHVNFIRFFYVVIVSAFLFAAIRHEWLWLARR